MNRSLISNGQQLQQYQPNENLSLTLKHWILKKTWYMTLATQFTILFRSNMTHTK